MFVPGNQPEDFYYGERAYKGIHFQFLCPPARSPIFTVIMVVVTYRHGGVV